MRADTPSTMQRSFTYCDTLMLQQSSQYAGVYLVTHSCNDLDRLSRFDSMDKYKRLLHYLICLYIDNFAVSRKHSVLSIHSYRYPDIQMIFIRLTTHVQKWAKGKHASQFKQWGRSHGHLHLTCYFKQKCTNRNLIKGSDCVQCQLHGFDIYKC